MEVGLAVGGAFLSSALNVFFDRMTPKFPNLFRGRKDDERILKKLKRTLRVIEAVLDDAEDKQTTNRHVNEWLGELKATVYDAEDLVDEINTEVLRLQVEGVNNTVSPLSGEFLNEIIPKIDDVVSDLKDFESQIDVLGLKRGSKKKDRSYRFPSTSLVDETEIYGRDGERKELIDMLLSDDDVSRNTVRVITIVGMGGLGKTTLAQLVYGDESVKKHFDKQAWVYVSENYDAVRITKTLVAKVTGKPGMVNGDKDDFDMLQVKLKESLAEHKFFVVLDDVWIDKYEDWDRLKAPLKYGKKGSIIIVTTRNENAANMMRTERIFSMDTLSNEDSWSLFRKHAFDHGVPLESKEFWTIGRKIVKNCGGLPLAIKALGGLLRSKREVKEWEDIARSEFWNPDNVLNDVLPILRLSYQHLPPDLKHCFAFCAVFPRNFQFQEEQLILLWMANDLLRHPSRSDKTVEELGHEYFHELISRCFLRKDSASIWSGDIRFLMHDLVKDLAQNVSGKFCVSEAYQHDDISSEVRHFLYIPPYSKFKFLSHVKNLRTLFAIHRESYAMHKIAKIFSSDIHPGLGRLRVLSLRGYQLKELPDSICKMKHLRYLDFSRTDIKLLPSSICSLYNLQTLLLRNCHNLRELPHSIGKMKHLRYADFSLTAIKLLPDSMCSLYNLQTLVLRSCRNLHQLPMDLTKLVNLRHLDLEGTCLMEMPSHMSRLRSLQTLTYYIVDRSSSGKGVEELEKLNLRGYLKIMGLQNVVSCEDALKACLGEKNHLERLVLEWSGDTNDSHIAWKILEKLQPHTRVKNLLIAGYGGTTFPHWLGDHSFCNIVSLRLISCVYCVSLPALGQLASLKSLAIKNLPRVTRIGEEFFGAGFLCKPFQSLQILIIVYMLDWEEWDISAITDFSNLEELYIRDCPKFKGNLPSQLLSLRIFQISGCQQLVCLNDWVGVLQDNQVGSLPHHLSSLRCVSISDITNLKELPEGLLSLGLKDLTIERCDNLVSFPKVKTCVDKMTLRDCASLVSPPALAPSTYIINCMKMEFPKGEDSDDFYSAAEHLQVVGVPFNNTTTLGSLPNLQSLQIESCEHLKVFPTPCGIQNLTLLCRLDVTNCNNMLSFPKGGLPAPNLKYLYVSECERLKSMPEQMHSLLPSLRALLIDCCPEIESFPEGGLPSSLEDLAISYRDKLIANPKDWRLQSLSALRSFEIFKFNEESFPEEGLLPYSLRELDIEFNEDLKTLNEKGLFRLTSLETLNIRYCPNLQSLPEEGLPTSLQTLKISDCPSLQSLPVEGLPTCLSKLIVEGCPLLKPHLERETGKYWRNIGRIPHILVDNVPIR